jgi:hypothetical protein
MGGNTTARESYLALLDDIWASNTVEECRNLGHIFSLENLTKVSNSKPESEVEFMYSIKLT